MLILIPVTAEMSPLPPTLLVPGKKLYCGTEDACYISSLKKYCSYLPVSIDSVFVGTNAHVETTTHARQSDHKQSTCC